jgi:copper(I)-binding protein
MRYLIALLLLVAGTQPALAGGLKINDAWAPPAFNGQTGAVFMHVSADAVCTINSVSAEAVAGSAELHTHIEQNGVMQMRKLDEILVTPTKSASFAPGGLHVMLFDLSGPLADGEHFMLQLSSKECGAVSTEVVVSKARLSANIKQRKPVKHLY